MGISEIEDALIDIKNKLCSSDSDVKLSDVISKFRKYLYLKDTKMLETLLAVVISNQLEGTPLWVIFCGNSGDAKSTQLIAISDLDNVIKLDNLTKNTFASGKPDVKDLGSFLQNNSNILLIPDFASISSKYKDDRKEIFASMRNLYDGYIIKHTGSGVSKEYQNCHTTLIAGSTPILKKEYLIHMQLGSRELIFDTEALPQDANSKMDMSWDNELYENQMKDELSNVVKDFINNIKVKRIQISDDIKEFLKSQAKVLSFLRAVGDYNQYTDELEANMYLEVPTRLIKQFKRLWICLKSLDDNYPDNRAKEIIQHIVKSSGNANRWEILNILCNNEGLSYTKNDIAKVTRLGIRTCKRELEALWNLGIVEKQWYKYKENKTYDNTKTIDKPKMREGNVYTFDKSNWIKLIGVIPN